MFVNYIQNVGHIINRTLHGIARRYKFYVHVARTISHSFSVLTHEILFLPLENRIHIFLQPCNILYILQATILHIISANVTLMVTSQCLFKDCPCKHFSSKQEKCGRQCLSEDARWKEIFF